MQQTRSIRMISTMDQSKRFNFLDHQILHLQVWRTRINMYKFCHVSYFCYNFLTKHLRAFRYMTFLILFSPVEHTGKIWILNFVTLCIYIFISNLTNLRCLVMVLTSCAGITCHARREFFVPKLQYFLSFKYIQI